MKKMEMATKILSRPIYLAILYDFVVEHLVLQENERHHIGMAAAIQVPIVAA
jgi:hypothetical protein